jgi:hypothetical protein
VVKLRVRINNTVASVIAQILESIWREIEASVGHSAKYKWRSH